MTFQSRVGVPGPKPKPLEERFFDCVMPEPNSGCWLWIGAYSEEYGVITVGSTLDETRKREKAHRVSWKIHKGPIPDELFVLHKCDVRPCVNPDHLFLGTNDDNLKDMMNKGSALKPTCRQGHPRTPENTYIRTRGHRVERVCKICKRNGYSKQGNDND